MNKETRSHAGVIDLWLKICSDYYAEDSEGIDYEMLEEVGITFTAKRGDFE